MAAAAPAPASEWAADANESLRLSLIRTKEDRASLTAREVYEGFNPTFTYPIFGEDEKLYGYKNLVVELKFASGSLAQYLKVSYSEKLPSTSSVVDDIEGTLANFIPPGYYKTETEFLKRVEEDATAFKPYGTLIHSYSRSASKMANSRKPRSIPQQVYGPEDEEIVDFEVYHTTWDTPGFREYHRRMQLFILLYIEGGSYIREEEDAWEFVVLYEKRRRRNSDIATYHFVGYSSLYPFYCFPEKIRMRLSQFVILPPYQQEGHGSALYAAIYQYVLGAPNIAELTVEDPAEAFEDLRDRNDLKMLLNHERFMREAIGDEPSSSSRASPSPAHHSHSSTNGNGTSHEHSHGHGNGNGSSNNGSGNGNGHSVGGTGGRVARGRTVHHERSVRLGNGRSTPKRTPGKLGPPVDRKWMEKWRVDLKIASRQFSRLIEMLTLKHMDFVDPQATKQYRLQVKQRLYRFNFESLSQMDQAERQQRLDETFQNVRKDYERILATIH